jgi:two-component system, NtrC family, sensor kinase
MTRHLARREFISLVGSVAASPVMAWAQESDNRVRMLLGRILRLQADGAADKIDQFIEGIKSQVGWTTQMPWRGADTLAQRRFDALRLLRQVPAIQDISQLDPAGHEQLNVSRSGMDKFGVGTDYSGDLKFTEAVAKGVYYGPVDFSPDFRPGMRGKEPYMTLSLAGTRRDAGVSVAKVSLKQTQDLVARIKVGDHGVAYVLDWQGRVIAHSDASRVQQDFSSLAHVRAAHTVGAVAVADPVQVARDINGREVLVAYSRVASLGWPVFVELSVEEGHALSR